MTDVQISLEGLDELVRHMDHAPRVIRDHLVRGMKDAADEVINTRGVGRYPRRTQANMPPPPYYQRGRGRVTRSGRLMPTSERLGTQFYKNAWLSGPDAYGLVGQRASYGRYVVGDRQPRHMADKGWLTLKRALKLKAPQIRTILEYYVERALRFVHLWP